jgi:hypothetical protein
MVKLVLDAMLDVFQTFEKSCLSMAPEFIVPLGISLTGVGICMWLGGLAWNRITGALLGAMLSGICVLFLAPMTTEIQLTVIGVAAVIGMIFNKPVIIVSGGILAGIIALIIFAGAIEFESSVPTASVNSETGLDVKQSATLANGWAKYYTQNIYTSLSRTEGLQKLIASGITLTVILIAIALRKLVAAMSCSAIGTIVVFSGMITLLLYKGSQPLTHIFSRPAFYSASAVCMIVFGTVVEMLLCPAEKNKIKLDQNGEQK